MRFIDGDPHCYTRGVKYAIDIRLHPNNINRDSRIDILEAHDQETQQQVSRTTADGRGNKSPKQCQSQAEHRA